MKNPDVILETERLLLRKLEQSDYADLCKILQDEAVMYAYEGAFCDEEVQVWLDNQLRRYQEEGVGLYAVILKKTGELIGQCGLTMQEIPTQRVLEVGYLFQKAFWHQGFATEAARACKEYAFSVLGAEEVFSIIRDTNTASQNVAKRNGMLQGDTFVKHYRGIDMPHYIFSVKRKACQEEPMRIRPYIEDKDYSYLKSWINDERTHALWCANLIPYPMTKEGLRAVLERDAADWTGSAYVATDDRGTATGFFSYSLNTENNLGFFKFVVVDAQKRGQGYGKDMLRLALQYAFHITGAEAVQLNVFQENKRAKSCYESLGFVEREMTPECFSFQDELWSRCNMVIQKTDG